MKDLNIEYLDEKTLNKIKQMLQKLLADYNVEIGGFAGEHRWHASIYKAKSELVRVHVASLNIEYVIFILIPRLLGVAYIMVGTDSMKSVDLHISRMYDTFLKKYVTENKLEEICQKEENENPKEVGMTSSISS